MRLFICCLIALMPCVLSAATTRPAAMADGLARTFTSTGIVTDDNTQRSGGGIFSVGYQGRIDDYKAGATFYARENALILGGSPNPTPTFYASDELGGTYAGKSLWLIPDIDLDGRDDFAIVTVSTISAGVFSTIYAVVLADVNGRPGQTTPLSVSFTTTVAPTFSLNRTPMTVGDFNGDGLNDIAIVAAASGGQSAGDIYAARIYLQATGGIFSTTPTTTLNSNNIGLGSAVVMRSVDLDQDGKTDLLLSGGWLVTNGQQQSTSYQLVEFIGSANGINSTFTKIFSNDFNSGSITDITTGDVDGDGSIDLAFTYAVGSGGTLIYDPLGQTPTAYNTTSAGADIIKIVGDLDGDGRADLIYASPGVAGQVPARAGVILGRSIKTDPAAAFFDRTLDATLLFGNGSQTDPQRFDLFTANLDRDSSTELYALDLDGNANDTATLLVAPALSPKFTPAKGTVSAQQSSVLPNRPLNDLGMTLTYPSLLTKVSVIFETHGDPSAEQLAVPTLPAGILVSGQTITTVNGGTVNVFYNVSFDLTSSTGASAATFQTALRALTYNTTERPPSSIARAFTLIATDGYSKGTSGFYGGTYAVNVVPANVTLKALIVSKTSPYSGVVGQPFTVKVFDGVAPYVMSGAGFTVVNVGAFAAIADLDGDGDLDAGNTYTVTPTAGGTAGLTITDAANATFSLPVTVPVLPSTALRAFVRGQNIGAVSFDVAVGQVSEFVVYDGTAPYTLSAPGFAVIDTGAFAATTDLDGDGDLDGGRTYSIRPLTTGVKTITVSDATQTSVVSSFLAAVQAPGTVLDAQIVGKTAPYTGVVGQALTLKVFDGSAPYTVVGTGFTVVDAGAFTATADLDGDEDLDAGNTYTITPTAAGTAGLTITDSFGATFAVPITVPTPTSVGSTALRAFISGQQQATVATATVGQGLELVIYDGIAPYTITAPGFSVQPLANFSATTDLDGDSDLDAGQTAVVTPTAAGSATITVTDASRATWTVTVVTTAPAAVSVTAPTLSLSTESTVYATICPGSAAALASLATAVSGRSTAEVRVFSYDPSTLAFVEYPAAPTGGFTSFTGFFIATRVALPLDFSGTPVGVPLVFTLPPGFSLQGLPLMDHNIFTTSFANEIEVLDATGVVLTGAARTAVVGSGVYFWNGSVYVLTDTIDRGQAYWFRNRTSTPVTLRRRLGSLLVSAQRESAATALAASEAAGDLPPPPPGASVSAPAGPANGANSGSCGMGSGVALLGVALLGLLRLRFRRSAWAEIRRD